MNDMNMVKLLSILILGSLTALAGAAIEWDRRRRTARFPMRVNTLRNRRTR